MNRHPEDISQLLNDLAAWCSAEPRLDGEPAYQARILIGRFRRQRRLRQQMVLATTMSLCLAAGLMMISFRAPGTKPLTVERPAAADRNSGPSTADWLTESADDFIAQFAMEAAAVDQRNSQIQEEIERLASKFPSLSDGATPATIHRYHAARRQRAQEQMLDRWLAANP